MFTTLWVKIKWITLKMSPTSIILGASDGISMLSIKLHMPCIYSVSRKKRQNVTLLFKPTVNQQVTIKLVQSWIGHKHDSNPKCQLPALKLVGQFLRLSFLR